MSGGGDVIVADIYCIFCGQSLRLHPVGEPCPGCGATIAPSLHETILAGGHRHVRHVGRALLLAGWLNVGLGLGCILNPLTIWDTSLLGLDWYVPLEIVFLVSVSLYAWLQVLAAMRAAQPRPGVTSDWRRTAILLTGICFGYSATAGLAGITMHALGVQTPGLYAAIDTLGRWLLPALAGFIWLTGDLYQRLCRAGGMHPLERRAQRNKHVTAFGSLLIAVGALLAPAHLPLLDPVHLTGTRALAAAVLLAAGLVITVTGIARTTLVQLRMGARLRNLADTLGDRIMLTGAPVE